MFYIANYWVIFENGLLDGAEDQDGVMLRRQDSAASDFEDFLNVTQLRFGAQERDQAVDPLEEAFLELRPPNRTWSRMIPSQADRLSARARRVLDKKIIFVDSSVLWVQANQSGQVRESPQRNSV